VRAYVNIFFRLVACWGHLPPEVIAAGTFAVPAIVGFLAGLPYVPGLVAGGFVSWWCAGIIKEHVWPDVPPEHRKIIRALRDLVLLKRPSRKPQPRSCRSGEAGKAGRDR
jgi:hypothetical protein